VTQEIADVSESIRNERGINTAVTLAHLTLILGATIVAFWNDNFGNKNSTTIIHLTIALLSFTALQDIYLSYNMFFILDEEKKLNIIYRDQVQAIDYEILEVIKADVSICTD